MMSIEYDARLVELAVLAAAQRSAACSGELHAAIDPLYELPADERREQAFRRAFSRAFARFDLGRVVEELLDQYPLIRGEVGRCIVRVAQRKSHENVELLVCHAAGGAAARTLVVQARPESLVDSGRLRHVLQAELLHVADMLDPVFGYQPADLLGSSPRQNLVRDRYRVLWDLYVEGRLRAGDVDRREALERWSPSFIRVFGCRAEEGAAAMEHVLRVQDLTHQGLLEWADQPQRLLQAAPQGWPAGEVEVPHRLAVRE